MMGKKLARVVVLMTLMAMLGPVTSFALGLGPITMRSALNQPLLAEIDVHSLQPGDLDKLAIRLASHDDFKRVNVERSAFLSRIKFALSVRDDGSAYVKLTTTQPVTEPYLDFLIEAKWPRGRALKEYTVLVDPPVLTAETPAPVQQATVAPVFAPRAAPRPQSKRPIRKARPAPVTELEPEPSSRRFNQPKTKLVTPVFKPRGRPVEEDMAPATIPAPQPSLSSDPDSLNYGVVRRNDTLSEIAQEMRTESEQAASVSMQQLMLALLRSNPKAFIRGNINQLKAGVTLRIDDPFVLQELSQSEAVAEVRTQTIAWRDRKAGRLLRQVESSEDVATADRDTDIDSRATTDRIAEEDSGAQLKLVAPGKEGQGTGSGKESGELTKLNSELLLATESLDANRQETGELKTRLSDLEEQLSSMQRLIMLKDEEMLVLQNRLKDGIDTPATKTADKEDRSAPKRPEMGTDDEGFLSDTLLMGIAALLVVGVIGWLVIRRRKMQSGFEESILNVGMADQVGMATFSGTASQPHSQSGTSDFAMSDMSGIESDSAEVDPISEADVYLAYGRHQQAEDIIQQALGTTPDRLDLHVKLLEVYHAAHNRPAFEEHAQQFHTKIGGDESNTHWARVAELGAEIAPDHVLFGGGGVADIASNDTSDGAAGVTAEEEDLLDFDFDTAGSMDTTDLSGDDALDLDVSGLDFDLEDELNSETLANIDNIDSDNSIEFDMGTTNIKSPPAASTAKGSELDLSLDSGEKSLDTPQVTEENAGSDQLAKTAVSANSPELTLDMGDDEQASDSGDEGFDFDFDVLDTDSADVVDDGIGGDSNVIAFDGESMGDDLDDDIFSEADEVGTKLDLAKAYVDMGDSDGARSILDEVMEEGDDDQKHQAEELLQQMG